MNESELPSFPISVVFHEDGEEWILSSQSELESNLEWFDSRDSEERVSVTDSKGRKVVVVVEKLELKLCQLA